MGYGTIMIAFIETLKENPDGISEEKLISYLIEKIPKLNSKKRFSLFRFQTLIGKNDLTNKLNYDEALVNCFKFKNKKFYFKKSNTYTKMFHLVSNPFEGLDYETEIIKYFEKKSVSVLERGNLAEQISRYAEIKGFTNTEYLRMFAQMYANIRG